MSSPPDYDVVAKTQQLPSPQHGKAGSFKTMLLALFSILILACAGFWLTLSSSEKKNYREQTADFLSRQLAGTPFASLTEFLRPKKPSLPDHIIHPPTASGTLSGQKVTGTIAAPLDFDSNSGASNFGSQNATNSDGPFTLAGLFRPGEQTNPVVFDQEPIAPVSEDTRIRPSYLASLAQWLVNHYKPGAQGGVLSANIQALNQECGGRLANQGAGGRSGLLRYAFHPSMIQGLYKLYIDRFMEDLGSAATKKGFTPTQNKQFHRAIAGRAAILASILSGVLLVPDLDTKLSHIESLAQKTVDANVDLAAAVFELDEARNSNSSRQTLATGQMRIDGASARYRRASTEHAQAQSSLAAEIRRYSGQNVDEDTLLFLAAWVRRRYAEGGQAKGAIESCIAVLRDLSSRCARFGEGV